MQNKDLSLLHCNSMANGRQFILNAFSKVFFWPQLEEKKMGDRYSIDKKRGEKTIFFDENALFSLWFHLINLRCPKVRVCKDDQGKVDVEKADKVDRANTADRTNGIDRADRVDKADRADRTNRADRADRADRIDGANKANKANGVDGADRGRADIEELDGADGGRINIEKPDKVDKADEGGADIEELDRRGTAAEDPSLGDPRVEKQRVARQAAIQLSFFSFCNVFCLFFSSSKSKTCGSWYPHITPHLCL